MQSCKFIQVEVGAKSIKSKSLTEIMTYRASIDFRYIDARYLRYLVVFNFWKFQQG